MRPNLSPARALCWACVALGMLVFAPLRGQAAELKLQAQLVWCTDDSKPPEGKNYKPVETSIQKKLPPLKWKNYFEVNRTDFTLTPAAAKKVPISEKCSLNVLNQSNSTVEVSWIGKGKEVLKRTQSLSKGDILILGGNAPNATAYLVILKRLE